MNEVEINIEKDDLSVFGIWTVSSDKTLAKDIRNTSKKYYNIVNKKQREVLPFFVVNKDYDENTGELRLFIGGLIENNNLDKVILPKGHYATMTIKPKLGFLWGLAIGEAKRYFYRKWLPNSDFQALNLDYECHTIKSVVKNPEIQVCFAIEKK